MPFNLLLLPLLGGFWLLHRTERLRYRAYKAPTEQSRLVEAATAGLFLLTLSRLIVVAATQCEYFASLQGLWHELAPWPYSGTAFGSFALGLALSAGINLWDRLHPPPIHPQTKEFLETASRIEVLMYEAVGAGRMVMLTLSSGKVYAGFPMSMPTSTLARSATVSILPMLSGYRTEQHEIVWTTDYSAALDIDPDDETPEDEDPEEEHLDDPDLLEKVIPVSAILVASLFLPDVQDRFLQADAGEQAEAPSDAAGAVGTQPAPPEHHAPDST
jgi:hypothetical protein